MGASYDRYSLFLNFKWLVNSGMERPSELHELIIKVVHDCKYSETVLRRDSEVLAEEVDELVDMVVRELLEACCSKVNEGPEEKVCHTETEETAPAHVLVLATLTQALPRREYRFKSILALTIPARNGERYSSMLEKPNAFDRLRALFGTCIVHLPDQSYHSYTLLQALLTTATTESKDLGLHEELTFLLGCHGRHEAGAYELAAERNLAPDEALARLTRILSVLDKPWSSDYLVTVDLRVSCKEQEMRSKDASKALRCGGGSLESEKLSRDGRCCDNCSTISVMCPSRQAALEAGNERLRLADII